MPHPNFSLPDPQRAEFEKRYPGKQPPHFDGGDISHCRPMTVLELQQFREYTRSLGHRIVDVEYKAPF